MGTITGLTASRMLEIEAESIVDGNIVGNDLVLVRHDGVEINAGNVRGIQGLVGPAGSAGSTSRIDIQMSAANAIEIHLGATGLADALNITPTGPTGVRFVSGADYVGGVSTARADEAMQFEIFDHGFNFYVDLSTTAGFAYTPTKRVTINSTGIFVYLAGSEKVRLDASAARAAFTGDFNGIAGFNTAGDSKYLFGLRPDISGNSDDLVSYIYAGKWGWYAGAKRMELGNAGGLSVVGDSHYFGANAFSGVGGRIRLYAPAGDPANAYIQVESSAANIGLHIQAKGTGDITLRSGGGTDQIRINDTGVGFYGQAPQTKGVVTGSRGGNAALTSLLAQLNNIGIISDTTTA